MWIATGLASVGLTAGVLVAVKSRKPRATRCRICGAEVPERGDLCPKCRHETAEAIRRSAAERDEQLLAQDRVRRQQGEDERSRLQKSREDEEARLRREEETKRQEEARQRESQAAREQQASRPPEASDDVFDPYAVLGLSRDASAEEIEHAYSKAKLKYDVDQVAGFGNELQDHYKLKAQAVERAYQMLRQ
jgi:DnaJ-domain-containing protein 1